MPYVVSNFTSNAATPIDQWVCAPTSKLGPFKTPPTKYAAGPDYCGQCVSLAKQLCPTLPSTGSWTKGSPVKGNSAIVKGTVIANFDTKGKYGGHTAIYVSQSDDGLTIFDQWVTGTPKAIGERTIGWIAPKPQNSGSKFYVVD